MRLAPRGSPQRALMRSRLRLISSAHLVGHIAMKCHELASRIELLQPGVYPRDVARLCLLLANHVDDIGLLHGDHGLAQAWQDMGIRLQAATDQHAAMTEDLEQLAGLPPEKFTADQIWTLIRAIKVQSQVLQLYVGQPAVV